MAQAISAVQVDGKLCVQAAGGSIAEVDISVTAAGSGYACLASDVLRVSAATEELVSAVQQTDLQFPSRALILHHC